MQCINDPDEKYSFYCKNCKRNLCHKCVKDCIEHEIINLKIDINLFNKCKYIVEKIKERNQNFIDDENYDFNKIDFENDDNNKNDKYEIIEQNNSDDIQDLNISNDNLFESKVKKIFIAKKK